MGFLIISVFCLILCLLLIACIPTAIANSQAHAMRRLVTSLVGLQTLFTFVLILVAMFGGGQEISIRLLDVLPASGLAISIYYDGATSLMLPLVAFVGFVVSRFSIRYLDGEAAQGRYFRWLGFTIGAVSLMVLAGNLILFFLAWVMTSLGLHQLLLHYRHRPAAHRAAWTKFAISRLGDLFLVTALVLLYKTFGTFELSELFAQAGESSTSSSPAASHVAAAWLLMLGAVTKSAQFPFHVWLPDTMETPTPVSALMHAGIVNAGGYLVIRMSTLFVQVPEALLTLSLIGAFTACFAGIVMMTQPSVKRALAYSTIAQMGFMMLQCGLGAFSAAMLHIVAHSLYKAHAFLTSGSVVAQSQAIAGTALPNRRRYGSLPSFIKASAACLVAVFAISLLTDFDLSNKPGGFVLMFILFLALTTWAWRVFALGQSQTTWIGFAGVLGLWLVYTGSYFVVDHLLQPIQATISPVGATYVVFGGIAAAFALLFLLHVALNRSVPPAWLVPLRIHAANGFYIDAIYQRVFGSFAKP